MECSVINIKVHYELFGEGKPIIILPGWTSNSRIIGHRMEPIFQERTGWQRIYIDPPGHGKTPGKPWITNLDDMLEVILACIDKLTAGQRFCLYGSSLGAYLARGVLRQRGGFVDGLAMSVPAILTDDEKRTVPAHVVLVKDLAVAAELTPEETDLFGMSVIHNRQWLDYLRSFPKVPASENGDPDFLDQIRSNPENYAFSYDVDALPEPFAGPALIIAGRQDSVVGYQDAWNILDNYPRATYVVLDKAGHLLEQSNKLIYVLVDEWLDRVEEWTSRALA